MVWKYITYSKRMFPPKAIVLALLLQGENKIGMELCKYLRWLAVGNGLAQSCSPGRQRVGITCACSTPEPELLPAWPRIPREGKDCSVPEFDMIDLQEQSDGDCLPWGSVHQCISPVPSEQLCAGSPPCRLTSLIPPQGSHILPWNSPGLSRHRSSLFPIEYLWDSVWKQSFNENMLIKNYTNVYMQCYKRYLYWN